MLNQLGNNEYSSIMRLKKEKELEESFFNELVTFISRHFIDDRIANPDLKEIYLVRLNVLL